MKLSWSIILLLVLFALTMTLLRINTPIFILFIVILITLIKAAHLLGHATEEVANYYSSTIGGLLNATLGNLAELVIAFFAIKAGLIEIVKASLTGSIIGNVLLVFGMAVIAGGVKKK